MITYLKKEPFNLNFQSTIKILAIFFIFFYFFSQSPTGKTDTCSHASDFSKNFNIINTINTNQSIISDNDNNKLFFTIQLEALSNKDKANQYVQELSNKGIPVYLHSPKTDEAQIFRVRVGKFINRTDAIKFSAYCKWKNSWIIKDNSKKKQSLICKALFDDISLESASLYSYVSPKKQLFIIYKKNYGIEMAIQPSDLFLYMSDFEKVVKIDSVTGFVEKNKSIQFGKSVYLYSNPNGLAVGHFQSVLQEYSKKLKRSSMDIQGQCLVFNDGYDIRLTLMGIYDLWQNQERILDKPGFDYIYANNEIPLKGMLSVDQSLGNYQILKIDTETMQSFQGNKLIAYTQKTVFNHIKICVLFY
ncbi:Sporulation/cell division region, bacteria domain protein [Candidatus Magnetomorum sp. HK-1]|nr:Sporulation/cell division region, bacteria domain protein [Candidatus Magnetomorum sp. HK-1]